MAKTKTNKRFLELPLDPSDVGLSIAQRISDIETELGTEWKTQKTDEQIQDVVGALLTSGVQTNITVTYDDSNGAIDFVVTGGGGGSLDQEAVEDVVGALISTSGDINSVYDDNLGSLTISLSAPLITKLDNLPADQSAINSDIEARTLVNDSKISYDDGAAVALNTAKISYPTADSDKVANIPADQNAINTDIEARTLINDGKISAADIDGTDLGLITTNFDGILSSSDDTVQKAMDTIDNTVVGSGTTNHYNTIYTDRSGSTLTGLVNDVNTVFTVSQGSYKPGSMLVFLNGVGTVDGDGDFTESNPATGEITFLTPPTTTPFVSTITARYQVGTINSLDTGQPDQSLTLTNDILSLSKNGQSPDDIDLSSYAGENQSYTIQSVNYSILNTDRNIEFDTVSLTATLPTAVGIAGQRFTIIAPIGGTTTVDTTSSETINGNLTFTIAQGESLTVVSNGTNYRIV